MKKKVLKKEPRVAIIVVNYNGFDHSLECVESLLLLDYPNYSIIFVDNGSTDKSGDAINAHYCDKITYLSTSINGGVTKGNNAGIEHALTNNFEYVLFLNNDTLVYKNFLSTMIRKHEDEGTLVVPKIICHYDTERLDHFIGTQFNWFSAQPTNYTPYPLDSPALNVSMDVAVASTCCLLVPLNVIRIIGGMDENYFMYYDDSDFTIRARRAGFRIIYEPESIIYHKCNMTTKYKQPSLFEYYLVYRNVFYFYKKLCKNIVIKTICLAKASLYLMLAGIKAYVNKDRKKLAVIRLICRDVLNNKMGAPPDLTKLDCY